MRTGRTTFNIGTLSVYNIQLVGNANPIESVIREKNFQNEGIFLLSKAKNANKIAGIPINIVCSWR